MRTFDDFREVTIVDSEYHHNGVDGHHPPTPICFCALELYSGREYRLRESDLHRAKPPWAHGSDILFVSYNAPAELLCYSVLGWPHPPFVLDLLIELRQIANGVWAKEVPRTLLNALKYYGIPAIAEAEKERWRKLILTGEPLTPDQWQGVLDYCWTDVAETRDLLKAMRPELPANLDRCLYRSRYTTAVTLSMRSGIPVDAGTWGQFLEHREQIQLEFARSSPVYEGTTFKMERFGALLKSLSLCDSWPRTKAGHLSTSEETFKDFSRILAIEQLRQVRSVIDQLREPSFQVHKGRNYFSILPFRAETSRNSTIGCIFQAPAWLRALIQPAPGRALAYLDYEQEEFLVAGVLADDPVVLEAYATGDSYTPFAIAANLIPPGGSKSTHPLERAIAKTCMLALQYGGGIHTVARKAGVSLHRAQDLVTTHRRLFHRLREWSDLQIQQARWNRHIDTEFGWRLQVSPRTKMLTLRNFRVQGTSAEVLRLAHILLVERSIPVLCPVHDAFLLESSEEDIEDVAAEASRLMIRASEQVLGGFRLRVEAQILRYPDRLLDKRGMSTWNRVQEIVSSNKFNSSGYSLNLSATH